jgi:class 3 adenylate cyclase
MLDPGLINDMTEMLSRSLKPSQIDEIGRLLMRQYNSHEMLGMAPHITVPKRRAAESLISECIRRKNEDKLIKIIIELNESELLGKPVVFEGIERFMNRLADSGYVYDYRKRQLKKIKEDPELMPNWGALREGREYDITVACIDIVANSSIVKKYGAKKTEQLYLKFQNLLRRVLSVYNGRIWHWAGDGCLIAFTFKKHPVRSVLFAIELQNLLSVFNIDPDRPIRERIELRIGMDTGRIKFSNETGTIVSETINYAAHLEKSFTLPGSISISEKIWNSLPPDLKYLFINSGEFEGRRAYVSPVGNVN